MLKKHGSSVNSCNFVSYIDWCHVQHYYWSPFPSQCENVYISPLRSDIWISSIYCLQLAQFTISHFCHCPSCWSLRYCPWLNWWFLSSSHFGENYASKSYISCVLFVFNCSDFYFSSCSFLPLSLMFLFCVRVCDWIEFM